MRDPVARHISEFFETMWMFHPELIREDGAIDANSALEVVRSQLLAYDEANDRAANWFEREFHPALGIDVYEHTFDREIGFGCIMEDKFQVALLTLEKLDTNWARLARFLGYSGALSVVRSNIGEEKSTALAYRYVTQHLRLPYTVCKRIYKSRLVTHFYDAQTQDIFTKRWSDSGEG